MEGCPNVIEDVIAADFCLTINERRCLFSPFFSRVHDEEFEAMGNDACTSR